MGVVKMADSQGPSWPTAVVALGFIALVGFVIWLAVTEGPFDEIWAAVGSIVGVITGAIPSFFFYRASQRANSGAEEANQRAQAFAAAADPGTARAILERM
jgi:hypothetical protein